MAVRVSKSLFTNQRFLTLLMGQGLSYFGDSMAAVALPILVLSVTGLGFLMGLVGMLELAPLFLIGIAVGVWVDRLNRNQIMLLADFGRAVLTGLIPAAALLHVHMMPVIAIVSIASGTLSVFFGAAYTGTIPHVVAPEDLGRANGWFEAVESAAYALGPVLAGLLTSRIGAPLTIALDALSFAASAIAILLIRDRQHQRGLPSSERPSRDFWGEIRTGFQVVVRDVVLRTVSGLWASNRFAFIALIPALTFFVLRTVHGTTAQVGVAVGIYAIGSLIGTLAASNVKQTYGIVLALCGQGLMFVGALLLAVSHSITMVMIWSGLLGLGEGVLLVCYLTVRVSRVPDDVIGRVYAITSTGSQGMGAIGYLIIGGLLSLCGGRVTWLILALISIASLLPVVIMLRGRLLGGHTDFD